MQPIAAVERFLERLLERPTARLFRSPLQPIQIQRRIERAMESERLTTSDRTLVPNRFVVHLHPEDVEGFGDMTESLANELADAALAFARAHRFTLRDRPRVDLSADPTVMRTDIRIDARFADPVVGRTDRGRLDLPPPSVGLSTETGDPTATRVYTVPSPRSPRVRLHVTDPDGRVREVVTPGHETRFAGPRLR